MFARLRLIANVSKGGKALISTNHSLRIVIVRIRNVTVRYSRFFHPKGRGGLSV
jgi:hypothetical protein